MSWQILFATASSQISGPLAAIASPCNQRLQRLQCLMHMSHSHPLSQHFLLRATISNSCTLQGTEHPYPTQAMSYICLVSPGATSSVALPKSSPSNEVPRRLPLLPLPRVQCRLPSLPPSMSGGQDLGPCRWIATVERDHSSAMTFYRVQDVLLDKSASACWGVERWMFRFLHDHRCRCRCRASLRTRAQVHARYAEKYPSSGKKDA